MAITKKPAPMNNTNKASKPTKTKKRVIISVWFIMALLTVAAALALWMFSATPSSPTQTQNESDDLEMAEEPSDTMAKVTRVEPLHELDADVRPISFDALIHDLRDYPPEFKDSRYLKKHKNKWTVQVMDVSEHNIITDYLNGRDDRKKFAYFRYRDENNKPRYVLTYDVLKTPQLAKGKASSVDFGLPENVRVIPEEINSYLDIIETYELSGPIKDLSSNRTRGVRLKPTDSELAARRRAAAQREQDQSAEQNSEPSDIESSDDKNDTLSVQEDRDSVDAVEQIINDDFKNNASNNQGEDRKIVPLSESDPNSSTGNNSNDSASNSRNNSSNNNSNSNSNNNSNRANNKPRPSSDANNQQQEPQQKPQPKPQQKPPQQNTAPSKPEQNKQVDSIEAIIQENN